MSLRDELAGALCSHPEDHEAMHVQGCQCWRRADRIVPMIERALAAAEETGWSKAVSETIQHFSTGPQAGCGCAYCDPRTRYGNALAQARREQRERDARVVRQVGEVMADIILAQKD